MSKSGSPTKLPGGANDSRNSANNSMSKAMSSAFLLLPESLGVEKWDYMLKPTRDIRIKLEDKIDKKGKRKRKRKGKKSNLKKGMSESESCIDDVISAYTGKTSEKDNYIDPKDRIIEDFFTQQGKPREFGRYAYCENAKCKTTLTTVMTMLEIDDYDEIKAHDKLCVNVMRAMEKCKHIWKTIDTDEIKRLIRLCIIREINQVEARKEAHENLLRNPDILIVKKP